MRAHILYEALRQLGPVHLVVAPVDSGIQSPPDPPPRPDDRMTLLELDADADPRVDLVARLADPSQRARAAELHPRPVLCRPVTLAAAKEVALLVAAADLAVVMRLYRAPLLDVVLSSPDRPCCVLDVDDIESSYQRQQGQVDEAARYEALERHYLPRFDLVLATSDDDARAIASAVGVDATVVPNAVTLPESGWADPRWDVLFVGNMGYPPNAQGAEWLCQEVLPRLPTARVALVGLNPAPTVVALRSNDVFVSGTVPDVRPFYEASRMVAVPLQVGAGTSIKLLEALAHGLPVVSTTVGTRGVPVRPGQHLLVADDPDGFATACRRLLDDAELASALGSAGRELVRERYTVDTVAAVLAERLREAVSAGAVTARQRRRGHG